MKKLLIILAVTIFANCGNYSYTTVLAEEQTAPIEASVTFDWVNMNQVQRDEKIDLYKTQLFGTENKFSIKRKEFRNTYKDFLKDANVKTHYRLISNGAKETKEYNLSGFFRNFRGEPILYSYAIQPKSDLRHVYYYSALGGLAYVDDISDNYPNFPYHTKQYRANGKLAGGVYVESHDVQYIFKPNGKFKGVWYKEKMYDEKGKEIMTRTNW